MNTLSAMPQKKLLVAFSFLFLCFFANINTVSAQDAAKLFKTNCGACHSLKANKLVGPGLEGIGDRVPDDQWLFDWIKDNKAVSAKGDDYAKSLNPTGAMPPFTHLSDEEINIIVEYIKNPVAKAETAAAEPASEESAEDKAMAKMFKANCGSCHSLTEKKIVGPGLKGIGDRVPDDQWLFDWIKDNKSVIDKGDEYAKSLNPTGAMPPFTHLSDEEITNLVAFIKNPPAPAEKKAVVVDKGTEEPEGEDNTALILSVVIVALIILISILRKSRYDLQDKVNGEAGLPPVQRVGPIKELAQWIDTHRTPTAVIIIILVFLGMRGCWYTLKEDVGIYTGYHPTQPIDYSHKIHAGDNGIDCKYCHAGVDKSKTAGIPTVNVCMNCHRGISEGPTTGTKEIAKIYEAAGWDPNKGEYNKPQKPIKWVKVHNLPDFVFFSHKQHVKVGKQDCANCHGDVKSMGTVEQFAPLTMEWCVDCHRETEVPGMSDNPYYEKLHKNLAETYGEDAKLTVDKMGGIECAKCHY